MKRKAKNAEEISPKEKIGMKIKLKAMLGTHKPSAVLTVVNFLFCAVWIVTYIACTVMRASVFDEAIQKMANAQQNFTVTVTSPVFSALRIALYFLPVLCIAWAVSVFRGDKKAIVPEKKLLITVIVLLVVTCFVALLDVARLGIFSYL